MLFISRLRAARGVGAAEVVDDVSGGNAGVGVAFVVGELEVADDAVISVASSGLAQVHLPTDATGTE
jgi:hypothetical protein